MGTTGEFTCHYVGLLSVMLVSPGKRLGAAKCKQTLNATLIVDELISIELTKRLGPFVSPED